MTLRDFSESTRQTLLDAIKEAEAQDTIWLLSSIGDFFSDLSIDGDINSYEGDIQEYHWKIVDKKNTTATKLQEIWDNVYAVDNQHATSFQNLAAQALDLTAGIRSLCSALDPTAPGQNGIPGILHSPESLKNMLRPFNSAEYTADHKMQQRIQDLYKEERFSRKTWNDATPEERQQILQELYDEVQEIMGTDAVADINFEALGAPGSITLYGNYRHDKKQITLNSDLLSDASRSYHFLKTVPHELRHAYQNETVDAPGHHIVSEETRQVWDDNIEDYVSVRAGGMDAYQEQPIEWDARGFAGQDLRASNLNPEYEGSWEDTVK